MRHRLRFFYTRSSRAFSILEVLLALALSTALLAGLFSALSLFMRSFDSGRTHVEEAQLARSLLRQISRDLRSSVVESSSAGVNSSKPLALPSDFIPPAESVPEPMPPDVPLHTTVLSPLRETETGDAPRPRAMRLSGSSDRLDLCVRAGGPQDSLAALFAGAEPATAEPSAADYGAFATPKPNGMRQVSYFCYDAADPDRMLAHQELATGEQSTTTGDIGSDQMGLVRREQPWTDSSSEEDDLGASPTSDVPPAPPVTDDSAAGGSSNLAPAATAAPRAPNEYRQPGELELEQIDESLTPEVIQVAFRYFDGSAWYSSWDSDSDGGLPVAVDIAFWLAEPAEEARRPRRAGERSTAAVTDTSQQRTTSTSATSRTGTSSREQDSAGAEAGQPYGETAESMPDYRLVVYLPLASPRQEESAYPELSSPDELNGPMPPEPMPTSTPPAATPPARNNSIRSFFRPNAPRGPGGIP